MRFVLRAMARRWYLVLAVFAIAAGALVYFAMDGGTYSTKTIVTFRLAESATLATDNGTDSESVVAFAGAVAAQINRGRPTPRYSSTDAPFYGAGVREGVLVGLRDEGSQWAPSFDSALIEIQIVGRTSRWVEDQQAAILTEIGRAVDAQQVTVGRADNRLTASVEPLTKRIDYITYSRSTVLAAVGAMIAAAVIVAAWVAVWADKRVTHRRNQPPGRSPNAHRVGVLTS